MFKNTRIFQGFCCKLSIFLILKFRNSFFQAFFRVFFLLDFTMADTHTQTHTYTEETLDSSCQVASHWQILIRSPVCALLLVATSIFNNICFKFLFTLVLIIADCCCTSTLSLKNKFFLREIIMSFIVLTRLNYFARANSEITVFKEITVLQSSLSYKSHAHLFCKNRYHQKISDFDLGYVLILSIFFSIIVIKYMFRLF